MNEKEARAEALRLLRKKLSKLSRRQIEEISFEGACGPGMAGYEIRTGKITVPWTSLHEERHTFRLRDLLNDIESPPPPEPQLEMFA